MGGLKLQLIEFMAKPCNSKFVWGSNDCCSWVSKIIKGIYGINFYSKFYGRYSSRKELETVLLEEGVRDIEGLILKVLGPITAKGKPQLGDPVLLAYGGDHLLGICCGTYNLFLTENGTTSRPLGRTVGYWRLEKDGTSNTCNTDGNS